jgi:cell division protein FtsB
MKKQNSFVLILAVLAPIFIAGSAVSFRKYRTVAEEFRRQERRLAELLAEQASLRKTIAYFSSSINIEKEARARFNFIREGEIAVILVSPKPDPSPTPSPSPPPFYLRFFNWIIDR